MSTIHHCNSCFPVFFFRIKNIVWRQSVFWSCSSRPPSSHKRRLPMTTWWWLWRWGKAVYFRQHHWPPENYYVPVVELCRLHLSLVCDCGKGVEGDGCHIYNRSTRQLGYSSQHLTLVRAACVCCHGTKCPLLTAFFLSFFLSTCVTFLPGGVLLGLQNFAWSPK